MQKLWGVDAVGRKRKREKRLLFRFLFSLEFDQNCPFLSLSLPISLFFFSFFFVSFFLLLLLSGVLCVFVGERKAE